MMISEQPDSVILEQPDPVVTEPDPVTELQLRAQRGHPRFVLLAGFGGLVVVAFAVALSIITQAAPTRPAPSPPPRATAAPSLAPGAGAPPSATARPLDAPIGAPVDIDGLQVLTVLQAEPWAARPSRPGSRTIAVQVEVTALEPSLYNLTYFRVLTADGIPRRAVLPGRAPVLRYGRLAAAETLRGWLTFAVPPEGPYVLAYSIPLGTNGLRSRTVRVSLDAHLPPAEPPAGATSPAEPESSTTP